VRRALRVGVGRELDAGRLQLRAELREVFDDAVVDDRDPAVGGAVRVSITVGGAAVGGPARVADAGRTLGEPGDELLLERLFQVGELAGTLRGEQLTVDDGDAGRVIAAVLQPPQSVQNDVQGRAGAGIPHDSAHGSTVADEIRRPCA
jgi:hypothetical protein